MLNLHQHRRLIYSIQVLNDETGMGNRKSFVAAPD